MTRLEILGTEGSIHVLGAEIAAMTKLDDAAFTAEIQRAMSVGYDVKVIDAPDGGLIVKWRA